MIMLTFVAIVLTVSMSVQGDDEEYVRACYYTNWSQYRNGDGKYFLSDHYEDGLCTHIIYSFGKVAMQGGGYTIQPYEWNDDKLYKQLNYDLKSRDPKLKSLLAIGGWTHSSNGFAPMVATYESRSYFINSAINYLERNGFDGLDLDWEYPSQRERAANPEDRLRFTMLCQELKMAFKPRGLLLTAAVAAGISTARGSYEVEKIAKSLDFINLMTYDLHGSWEKVSGHHADASTNRPISEHSLYNTVNYWIESGAPANKLVLGLATYGRTWRLNSECESDLGSPMNGAGPAGQYTGENGFIAYYELCNLNWMNKVCTSSSPVNAPYGSTSNMFVGYDDQESIAYKVNNIMKAYGMKGYMFWAMDLDDFRGKCGQGKYPLMKAAKYAAMNMDMEIPKCSNLKSCKGAKVTKEKVTKEKAYTRKPTIGTTDVVIANAKCRTKEEWSHVPTMNIWCNIEVHCQKACQPKCLDKGICDRCECMKGGSTTSTTIPKTTPEKRKTTMMTTMKPTTRKQAIKGQGCRPAQSRYANFYVRWCRRYCGLCDTRTYVQKKCICPWRD